MKDSVTLDLNKYLDEQQQSAIAYDGMMEVVNDELSGKLLDIKKEFSVNYELWKFNEGENDFIEWVKEVV